MDWGFVFSNSIESAFGVDALFFALAAIGLNIHFGYAGLLNFGHAAFMAMGGYGLAVSVTTYGLPFGVGIAVGLALAVVLALLLGIPTLRLRSDYLAIATIATAEIVRLIASSAKLERKLGGTDGLQQFSDAFYAKNPYSPERRYGIGPIDFDARTFWVMTVGWSLVAIVCVLVALLVRSPWGRVLKAIREDEDAVRSLGKNVYAYKMQALVLGGVIGAMGGFIAAVGKGSVQPGLYSTETTFLAYVVLILGGAARVMGPVAGAMILWSLLSFTDIALRQASNAGHIPTSLMETTQIGQVRFMMVGLGLMLLVIFRPQGIFGDRREIALDVR